MKMKNKAKIYIDMDGVTAVWKPGTMEEILSDGYFLDMELQENIRDAVKILQKAQGVSVSFLSAVLTDQAIKEKKAWLKEKKLGDVRKAFVPCGQNKADYIDTDNASVCVLLDDFTPNLFRWESSSDGDTKFKAVKFLNGINNTTGIWQGNTISVDSSAEEIAAQLLAIAEA